MRVKLTGVIVLPGETIGIGTGTPVGDETKIVAFAGDRRQMIALAAAAAEAELHGEQIEVEFPDWAILEIRELP